MIRAALGQGRGYNIQLFPVVQDINQFARSTARCSQYLPWHGGRNLLLRAKRSWETAEWMSLRGGTDAKERAPASSRATIRKAARAESGHR